VLDLDRVIGRALLDDVGLVGGDLVGAQVALLGGGAVQDVVGRGPGRGPLLAQLVEQVGHGQYLRRPDAVGGRRTSPRIVLRHLL